MANKLGYRLAHTGDYELLKGFREECGWGVDRLEQQWGNPDRPLCVFTLGGSDIGMASWILELPDPRAASRHSRTVQISFLYICKKYQAGGVGVQAMQLLEQGAVDNFGAKALTLETMVNEMKLVDGRPVGENVGVPSKQSLWYKKLGYKEYKPQEPVFPAPTPKNPDHKFPAMFLKKHVELP